MDLFVYVSVLYVCVCVHLLPFIILLHNVEISEPNVQICVYSIRGLVVGGRIGRNICVIPLHKRVA